MESEKKATEMIIELQNKNAKLRMGLGKLLKICENTKQHLVSEVWQQQIGYANQMFIETDPNIKKMTIPLHQGVFDKCAPEVDWCGVDYDGRLVFGIAKDTRYTWSSERWRGFEPIGEPIKNTNFIPLTCLRRTIF
jgi:hypothetical protein